MMLPNILTVSRFFLTGAYIYFILQSSLSEKLIALGFFIAASITDYLDGYLARKMKCESNFGKIMDPIADKFLMLSSFLLFYQMDLMALWMVIVVFIREIGITLIRIAAIYNGKVFAAEKAGKVKTVLQIVAVYFVLFLIVFIVMDVPGAAWSSFLIIWKMLTDILIFVATIITIYSGYSFLKNNYSQLIRK